MTTPARVVVVPGEPGPLQVHEVTLPGPGPYQVVVKRFASGIRHGQLHQMYRPRAGAAQILGHESTGAVLAKGREVRHVTEGDYVMVTWVRCRFNGRARDREVIYRGARSALPQPPIQDARASSPPSIRNI